MRRLTDLEPNRRNRAMLRLGYLAGLKVSEICGLRWRDLQAEGPDGPLITMSRRGKPRIVAMPESMLRELAELRGVASETGPLFRSAKGGALHPSQVHRLVKQAAARAGLPAAISTQWLRRAHVMHLLQSCAETERAPRHPLTQATQSEPKNLGNRDNGSVPAGNDPARAVSGSESIP